MQRDTVAQRADDKVNDRYTRATGGLSYDIHAGYVRFMRRRPKLTSGRIDSNNIENEYGLAEWTHNLQRSGEL